MAFQILVESRLYTMFHYLGCCSRRCPSDPMYPWPTSEFTCRQSRWSSCLWMASHFRYPQLSASLPKIFFPAREFAQQHREGRSARDPIPWEKQSVNLHPGLSVWTIQEACFTWFLRGFPMGWSPSCPRTCSWMKLYWIFSLPSRFPPPPSMWFMGSFSPDKLSAWVPVLGFAFKETQAKVDALKTTENFKQMLLHIFICTSPHLTEDLWWPRTEYA